MINSNVLILIEYLKTDIMRMIYYGLVIHFFLWNCCMGT